MVGVVTADTAFLSNAGPDVTFSDPIKALPNCIANMKKENAVNFIIVLSHVGLEMDIQIADVGGWGVWMAWAARWSQRQPQHQHQRQPPHAYMRMPVHTCTPAHPCAALCTSPHYQTQARQHPHAALSSDIVATPCMPCGLLLVLLFTPTHAATRTCPPCLPQVPEVDMIIGGHSHTFMFGTNASTPGPQLTKTESALIDVSASPYPTWATKKVGGIRVPIVHAYYASR